MDACRSCPADQRPRNLLRLIETARAAFARPKRYRKNQELRRQSGVGNYPADQFAQQMGSRLYLVVFQKMNKITQGSGVGPVRKCLPKWRNDPPAKAAQGLRGGGKAFRDKEFLAADIAENSFQRSYPGKTVRTDRQRRNISKRKMADAAVRRKQDTEQAFSRGLECPLRPA